MGRSARQLRALQIALFAGIGAVGTGYFYTQLQLGERGERGERGDRLKIPPEWNMRTRIYVSLAQNSKDSHSQAELYEKAVKTLTEPLFSKQSVDISKKSIGWIAGYADLLRYLGLARARAGDGALAIAPLRAAQTISYGDESLKLHANVELFRQTNDFECLLEATGGLNASIPTTVPLENAEAFTELGKHYAKIGDHSRALNILVALHKALPSDNLGVDTLCVKAGIAGLIGQMLWKLKYKSDAKQWLQMCEEDSKLCSSAACRQTTAIARHLLDRMNDKE